MDMNRMATWDVAAFSDEGSLEALKAIILNCVFGHATKDYAQASSRLHTYLLSYLLSNMCIMCEENPSMYEQNLC